MYYLLLLHDNNVSRNAPQYYVFTYTACIFFNLGNKCWMPVSKIVGIYFKNLKKPTIQFFVLRHVEYIVTTVP
jgi:hypothetical protein